MPILSYKKSRLVMLIAFGVMVLATGLAGWKLYAVFSKIRETGTAAEYYSRQEWPRAEQAYKAAAANRSISYKEGAVSTALADLEPVTELNLLLGDMSVKARHAGGSTMLKDLTEVHQAFEQLRHQTEAPDGAYYSSISRLGGEQSPAALFAELEENHKTKAQLADGFARLRSSLSKQMEDEMAAGTFSEDAISALMQIPSDYWPAEPPRSASMEAMLLPYEEARLSHVLKNQGFSSLLQEGQRLSGLYRDWGLSQEWLTPMFEKLAETALGSLLQNGSLLNFMQTAKEAESSRALASSSAAMKMIRSTYSNELKKAEQLVKAESYKEALELYHALAAYKNTAALIESTEMKWILTKPERLLERTAAGIVFTTVITGSNQFGGTVYAVGATNRLIELSRLNPDHTVTGLDGDIGAPAEIRSIQVIPALRDLPVLLVEAVSSSRNARYIGFEADKLELRKLFDFEADKFEAVRLGSDQSDSLLVTNDTGEGVGQEAYYRYKNAAYTFDGIKPDFVEIALEDLEKYLDRKVRFTCTVHSIGEQKALVAFNGGYLLLTGAKLQEGPATITGTWSGMEKLMVDNQPVLAMKVQVAEAVQEQRKPTRQEQSLQVQDPSPQVQVPQTQTPHKSEQENR